MPSSKAEMGWVEEDEEDEEDEGILVYSQMVQKGLKGGWRI